MDDLENPTWKLWADNAAVQTVRNPVSAVMRETLNPQERIAVNKGRMFNGGTKGLGALVYGQKLGQAKTKKEMLDAILGLMVGGLPMATYSAATITPTAQKYNDAIDVIMNGPKTITY